MATLDGFGYRWEKVRNPRASLKMSESYLSIQYLRALAALMVVLHHCLGHHPWLYRPNALGDFHGFARGVDVFFVISGFIMATVGSKDQPGPFLLKRCIRVVPIYWAATLLGAMIEVVRHGPDFGLLVRTVQSLGFIPHLDRQGEAFPILPPGWTLNFEMFFYGLFALSLFSRRPVAMASGLLLALVMAGVSGASRHVVFQTFTSPQLLEFVAGMVLGVLRHQLIQYRAVALLMPLSIMLLLTSDHWLQSLVAATCVVAAGLSLERRLPRWAPAETLGDASYSLYLSHHFVLLVVLSLWKKLPLQGPVQFFTLIFAGLSLSVAVGLFGHRRVEQPLTQWLKRTWTTPRMAVATVS